MLLREFLMLRVAPLQARARPLWKLGDGEDKTRLRPGALPNDELDAVMRLLVGDNQEYPPSAFTPLFHRKDWEPLVLSRPTFDARGLVPPVLSGARRRRIRWSYLLTSPMRGKKRRGTRSSPSKRWGENPP